MSAVIEANPELKAAETAIQRHLDDFAKLGLEFEKSEVIPSRLAGDSEAFSFLTNAGPNRRLILTVFPGNNIQNRGFVAVVERAHGTTLNINEYLQLHGKENVAAQFVNNRPQPDLAAFVNRCLVFLLELVATDLNGIITGTSWQEVPTNWQGYR